MLTCCKNDVAYSFLMFVSLHNYCLSSGEASTISLYLVRVDVKAFANAKYPLLQTLKKYEVFLPRRYREFREKLRKHNGENELHKKSGVHSEHTIFKINFEEKVYTLDVSLNRRLLPETFQVTSYLESGEIHVRKPNTTRRNNALSYVKESIPLEKGALEVTSSFFNHCYYQGHVEEITHGQVIMSTCKGLRASIIFPDDILIMQPLSNTDSWQSDDIQYILYRSSDVIRRKRNATCVLYDSLQNVHSFLNNIDLPSDSTYKTLVRKNRDVSKEKKFVELFLIVDHALATRLGDLAAIESHVEELVNYIDGFYQKLGIRIVLSSLEVWSAKDRINVTSFSQETLDRLQAFRQSLIANETSSSVWVYADCIHLLHGEPFNGTNVGLGTVSTMCTSHAIGVNEDVSDDLTFTAATVAHELGHNFGLAHDSDGCQCLPAGAACIMAAKGGFATNREWSDCSKGYMEQSVQMGLQNCLVNVPPPSRIYFGPECGNDIVEAGEECDCGTADICKSTCCNATSCKLLSHAECDHGLCCSSCKFVASGKECRGIEKNECDLPEYCTGQSAQCPGNVYFENGSPCLDGKANCIDGVCLTHDLQCKNIWGSAATSSVDLCYELVNEKGDENGNCGRNNVDNTFIKCSKENMLCGKLMCTGGGDKPVVGKERGSYTSTIKQGGDPTPHQCKTLASQAHATDQQDLGLVLSGTICATGKECQRGVCKEEKPSSCSSSCVGNAQCDTLGKCRCKFGFAPPYCNTSDTSLYSDSQSAGLDTPILGTLAAVVVVIFGVGFFVLYRWGGGKERIEAIAAKRTAKSYSISRNGENSSKDGQRSLSAVERTSSVDIFFTTESSGAFKACATER